MNVDLVPLKSKNTAIKRNKPSAPLKFLLKSKKLTSDMKVLDYGCGRGEDYKYLKSQNFDVAAYDPAWLPNKNVLENKYDAILITYVFCVINKPLRDAILKRCMGMLNEGGRIFISVRRDVKRDFTAKNGSKQYAVRLNSPVIVENSSFCIYEIEEK